MDYFVRSTNLHDGIYDLRTMIPMPCYDSYLLLSLLLLIASSLCLLILVLYLIILALALTPLFMSSVGALMIGKKPFQSSSKFEIESQPCGRDEPINLPHCMPGRADLSSAKQFTFLGVFLLNGSVLNVLRSSWVAKPDLREPSL